MPWSYPGHGVVVQGLPRAPTAPRALLRQLSQRAQARVQGTYLGGWVGVGVGSRAQGGMRVRGMEEKNKGVVKQWGGVETLTGSDV